MISPRAAGYMELQGAIKDAYCRKVEGAISKELGCCNLFEPRGNVKQFRCGNCRYVKAANLVPMRELVGA